MWTRQESWKKLTPPLPGTWAFPKEQQYCGEGRGVKRGPPEVYCLITERGRAARQRFPNALKVRCRAAECELRSDSEKWLLSYRAERDLLEFRRLVTIKHKNTSVVLEAFGS